MKIRILSGSVVALMLVSFSACQSTEPTAVVTSTGGPSMQQAQMEQYNGPKARIAVNKFLVKSASGHGQLGQGLADMLTTSLFNSNRFIVLDRQDHQDIMAEQDLGASGRIREGTAAPIGQMEGAELLVTGAVTAFKDNSQGLSAGLGVPTGGGFVGLGGSGKHAYMAIDIKVVDTKTGRLVAATTVEGKSTDWFVGFGGFVGGAGIPAGIGVYQNTPAEKAIRVCIVRAVEYIASMTPAQYYH
ncbi:MAG: CsgG/HfaB family protein [Nitrospinota bacterium]|nr:CsgG/HfaB family protein [Nitrospinota bacterium]MDH5756840.1 CsgG/HfaB family protein [Nitrospinota bacterium]